MLDPPFGAGVGSVPIKTTAVQIQGFCLPAKRLGAGIVNRRS
jgi:hypothetical protein